MVNLSEQIRNSSEAYARKGMMKTAEHVARELGTNVLPEVWEPPMILPIEDALRDIYNEKISGK